MLDMPGHKKTAVSAGTSMIFDLRTWHAAMPNTSDVERRCLILSYTPFWHKPFGQVRDFAWTSCLNYHFK